MTSKIWLITPNKDIEDLLENDPAGRYFSWYTNFHHYLVRAQTAQEARALAAEHDNKRDIIMDSALVDCVDVGTLCEGEPAILSESGGTG